MSLSKSKCWCSNDCLHFLKCAVPLYMLKVFTGSVPVAGFTCKSNFGSKETSLTEL